MRMKEEMMTTLIPAKFDVVEKFEWALYLSELRGNYYNES